MKSGHRSRKPRSWGKNLLILLSISLNVYFLLTHPDSPEALRNLEPQIRDLLDEIPRLMPEAGKSQRREESKPQGEILIRRHQPSKTSGQKVQEESRVQTPSAVRQTGQTIVWISAKSTPRLVSGFTAERKRNDGIGTVVWRDSYSALILTAAHLLRDETPEVTTEPEGPSLPVDIVAQDKDADLALLRISTRAISSASAVKIANRGVASGTTCWFPATPEARDEILFRRGVALGRPDEAQRLMKKKYGVARAELDWFVLSASSFRGLSGAPILLTSGRLTGVLIGGIEYPGGSDRTVVMGPNALNSFLRRAAPREFGR